MGAMANCKATGKAVRLSAWRITFCGKRGVAHQILYVAGGSPPGEWSCSMLKPYPKDESEKPFRQMMLRWNDVQGMGAMAAPTFGSKITATVRNRRGDGWQVRPSAEQLDGKRFTLSFGWHIEDDDSSLYVGETAWLPWPTPGAGRVTEWPADAPGWIASGDLCDIREDE